MTRDSDREGITFPYDDHFGERREEIERLRLRAIRMLEAVSPKPKKPKKPRAPRRPGWLARKLGKLWGI